MPGFRGKAEALGKISSMFRDVGQTTSNIFKQRAEEKRKLKEEEKQKPFDDLRKRLLTSQVEQTELGASEKKADIESDQEIQSILDSVGVSDEERELVKTSPMKPNELLNVLKSARDNPQDTIKEYSEFLSPESKTGQEVRSKLGPGQLAALDSMLGVEEKPEDAVKKIAPVLDEKTEIGKQARVTEAFDPTEPGAFDEEGKVLQPGEKAPVKPTTTSFRFEDKPEEPANVIRARDILRKVAGKRPTTQQKDVVKRNQAIIDKFEKRQEAGKLRKEQREEKLSDIESDRKFQLSLFDKRMGVQRKQAETKAKKLEKQNLFNNSDKLRDDFDKLSKTFNLVNNAYGRIQASAKDPSAAGDLALIFNYMKMLDPGSTVREGEFATAQNAAGIPDILRAKWNKAIEGERLAPNTRTDFVDRSNKLFKKASETQQLNIDRFTNLANKFEVPPDLVVKQIEKPGNTTKKQQDAGVTPKVGLTPDEEDELAELEKRFGQ